MHATMVPTSLHIELQRFDRLRDSTGEDGERDGKRVRELGYEDSCMLLVALEGRIRLRIDGVAIDLPQGGCLLIRSKQTCCLEAGGEWEIVRFFFRTYEADGRALHLIDAPPLLIPGCAYRLSIAQVKQALGGDERSEGPFSPAEKAVLQARLQLLLGLMAWLEEQTAPANHEEAIRRTIDYIERHYVEEIKVEQLARMSGMIRWQFSRSFKAATGRKPIDYLIRLRVEHAKRLMSSSKEPLREISRQVGFKNEYYFSRCFHRITGCAPRKYADLLLSTRRSTVIDSLGRTVHLPKAVNRIVATGTNTVGELLALGVRPVGAGIAKMKTQVVYRSKLRNIFDIGVKAEPEQVALLRPELMLLGNSHPRDLAELEEIAPAITLNGRIGTYERIRYIAGLIDRGKAAEEWVSRYEAGVRKVRRKLSEFYTPGEKAAVYLILGDNLYVMGQSGFAATLYESLGFRPSDGAAGLIEQGSLWRQVSRDHVSQYAGDRNFVLASGGDLQIAETDPLFAALGSGKRHLVEASWNYDDPITRERLLPVLPHLFMEKLLVREGCRLKDTGAFRQESSSR